MNAIDLRRWTEAGVVHLKGLLDAGQLAALQEATRNLVGPTRDVLERVPLAAEIARAPAVRQAAARLLHGGPRLVRALWFDKSPTHNWPVLWHQDKTIAVAARQEVRGYGPWSEKDGVPHVEPPMSVLARMCTLRLHLDDCGPDSGALCVVPGTHTIKLDRDAIAAAVDAGPVETLHVAAGDAVAMRPLLLHSSRRAAQPTRRRVLHLEFSAAELPAPLRWR